MPRPDIVQVTTTVGSRDEAERLATLLVEERLAACAQVQGPITSRYRWNEVVESAAEWYCHSKTTRDRLEALVDRLTTVHPYDVPEVIAIPVVGGHETYLDWVATEVGKAPD